MLLIYEAFNVVARESLVGQEHKLLALIIMIDCYLDWSASNNDTQLIWNVRLID